MKHIPIHTASDTLMRRASSVVVCLAIGTVAAYPGGALAVDGAKLPPAPIFVPGQPASTPDARFPEFEMTRLNREAHRAWFEGPIRDTDGRVKYTVWLDPAAIERTLPREAAAVRIDSIAKPWHRAATRETIAQMEQEHGFRTDLVLSTLVEGFGAFLDEEQFKRLKVDARVSKMFMARRLSFSGGIWSDTTSGQEVRPWGVSAMGGPLVTGDSAPVFVVDSGASPHWDLNVVAGEAAGDALAAGCYQHATFIAGVIGGRENGALSVGVRPQTPIWSIAAGDNSNAPCWDGSFPGRPLDTAGVSAALELVRQRARERCEATGDCRAGIVNLSFNDPANWTSGQDPNQEFVTLVQALVTPAYPYPGVLVVHSAGNGSVAPNCASGQGGMLTSCVLPASSQTLPSTHSDGYLRIGGLDRNGQPVRPMNGFGGFWNRVQNFAGTTFSDVAGSNYGPYVDIWAPSKLVRSSVSQLPGDPTGVALATGSGTSFAAPHVAALAADVRQVLPNFTTPGQLESAVRQRLFWNAARDLSGTPVMAAHVTGTAHRARPTVELLGRDGTEPDTTMPLSGDAITVSAQPFIPFVIWTDAVGTTSSGACDHYATFSGSFWFQRTQQAPVGTISFEALQTPGTAVLSVTCRDATDPSIVTSATASIQVTPKPPRLRWNVDGTVFGMPNASSPLFREGAFNFGVIAEGMSSCTMQAWTRGYSLWPPSDPDQVAFPWYGPVPISPTGHQWGTVLLNPDLYTWEARCFDWNLRQHVSRIHITVGASE